MQKGINRETPTDPVVH